MPAPPLVTTRPRDTLLIVGVVCFIAWAIAMLSPYAFGGWQYVLLGVATVVAVMRILRGPPAPVPVRSYRPRSRR